MTWNVSVKFDGRLLYNGKEKSHLNSVFVVFFVTISLQFKQSASIFIFVDFDRFFRLHAIQTSYCIIYRISIKQFALFILIIMSFNPFFIAFSSVIYSDLPRRAFVSYLLQNAHLSFIVLCQRITDFSARNSEFKLIFRSIPRRIEEEKWTIEQLI